MIQTKNILSPSPPPFPRSYWVVPGLLLAGEFPGSANGDEASEKVKGLLDAGISHVVNLMEPDETDHSGRPFAAYDRILEKLGKKEGRKVTCVRFPVRDLGTPPPETMREILDSIDRSMETGHATYVHCWGGIGRTGTTVGCFLLRHGIADLKNVFEVIARLRENDPTSRRPSPETREQENLVLSWPEYEKEPPSKMSRFTGCMLGGAVGDALGAPVEFLNLEQIRRQFGPEGLTDYHEAYGRIGSFTDDTQMALFTAEGLLRGANSGPDESACTIKDDTLSAVHHSYVQWLNTQGLSSDSPFDRSLDGFLVGIRRLHCRRAPGSTCITALLPADMGNILSPDNNSKCCGGVKRIAPVGLFVDDPEEAFDLGCDVAAITHGHPSGYLASGFLAAMICSVKAGDGLKKAIKTAAGLLKKRSENEECLDAVKKAVEKAGKAPCSQETVETIGAGWIAEEALAVSIYCALTHQHDFAGGVLAAVNHGGDSDTTGAVTGNILGTLLGRGAINPSWIERLELKEVIEKFGTALYIENRTR